MCNVLMITNYFDFNFFTNFENFFSSQAQPQFLVFFCFINSISQHLFGSF